MILDLGNGDYNDVPNYDKESINDNEVLHIYIDGNYCRTSKKFKYSFVAVASGLIVNKSSGSSADSRYISSGRIAGQVFGTLYGIQYAIDNNYKKVVVNYNYDGIKEWAIRRWDAKKLTSQKYVETFFKFSKLIYIDFRKSRNRYSRLAYKLVLK